jgi:SAM-dependent methyltransferase/NAD(P)-dependent dehydrogenase (short-subunit alcohol dehydrogenase family)/acyl carrier protein
VTEPSYWSRQLRQGVRFADGMRTLLSSNSEAGKNPISIEAGPGNTLSTFVREITKGNTAMCVQSLPGPDTGRSDIEQALNALGQLWANGVEVDWEAFHRNERRLRVALPTYPFERRTYWVGTKASLNTEEPRDPYNWFYRALWREEPLAASPNITLAGRRILVLDREKSPGAAIVAKLRQRGCDVLTARPGKAYARLSEFGWSLNPDREEDFRELAGAVCDSETRLSGVIDCWSATSLASRGGADADLDAAALESLLAPMRLAHALSGQQTVRPLPMLLVAVGTARVLDADELEPPRAMGSGVARVLPQEHPGLRVAHIDADEGDAVADMVVAELAAGAPQPALALRNGKRFVEAFEPVPIRTVKPPADLPPNPVVLITGGLGHMGINLAEALFKRMDAKLILLGRSPLPEPTDWAAKSRDPETPPLQKALLERLAKMRGMRDEVIVVSADMNDAAEVRAAVDRGFAHFGRIDVVVHGAARIDPAAFGSAAETGWDIVNAQFSPKLRGLLYLMDILRGREPLRWILHGSISSVLGGLALAAYAGANAMLDALALQQGPHWLSIDWDAWDNAGEAQSASMPSAIRPPEGSEVLLRLMGSWEGSRALVVINFAERLKAWVQHAEVKPAEKESMDRHPRPNVSTAFVEPRTETERLLAEIWASQLGLEGVGIHDRFFDLGGHSLLAAQIASEICDRFQIELPVLKLFQAPTVGELAVLVDHARAGTADADPVRIFVDAADVAATALQGNAPEVAAKESYREFYNDVTRRLEQSGMGDASFFLNYGYISQGDGDEARFEVPAEVFNRNSVRLALELVGTTPLEGRKVLDVGCGRGGTVALLGETFGAAATGVDLSPEAIAFCRKVHGGVAQFEVGDAEHLPFGDGSFQAVTNLESSHTYPNLRAFYKEVGRVLEKGGTFLYADLLPVQRWAEVRVLLKSLGLRAESERNITANVLASCDEVAANRTKAFGGSSEMIDNFLAVPGSAVYEQMRSGAWEYRIMRARRV